MATYFVSALGSNTAPYDTWAKAATSLQTALTAATANGDVVVLQYDNVPAADKELSADTSYVFGADIALISASNNGGSAWSPVAMGVGQWVGNSTTNRSVALQGVGKKVYIYGVHFLVSGSITDHIRIGSLTNSANTSWTLEDCWLDQSNTSSSSLIYLGAHNASNNNSAVRLNNTKISIASSGHRIYISSLCKITGGSITGASGSALFMASSGSSVGGARLEAHGLDASSQTGEIVGDSTSAALSASFSQCRFGAGFVPFAASPAAPGLAAGEALYLDCAAGDQHYHLIYANALGTLTTDTGIYANDGAQYDGTNRCSWRITTTSVATTYTPFVTPWISKHHAASSAITPSLEVLRDGSISAYTDAEVWGEWSSKVTSGSTLATIYSDRAAVGAAGTSQAAGVGLAEWTGESATAWSGKLAPASSITPAEIGDICARVCVGAPSVTVYVDPTIRGT